VLCWLGDCSPHHSIHGRPRREPLVFRDGPEWPCNKAIDCLPATTHRPGPTPALLSNYENQGRPTAKPPHLMLAMMPFIICQQNRVPPLHLLRNLAWASSQALPFARNA